MRSNLKAALAAAVIVSPVLATAPAVADTIYTYTGHSYTSIGDGPIPAGSYDFTMSVNGSFTLANPLAAYLSNSNITASVLSFSFFDGRTTLDTSSVLPGKDFRFSTDAAGNITGWDIGLVTPYFGSLVHVGDGVAAI